MLFLKMLLIFLFALTPTSGVNQLEQLQRHATSNGLFLVSSSTIGKNTISTSAQDAITATKSSDSVQNKTTQTLNFVNKNYSIKYGSKTTSIDNAVEINNTVMLPIEKYLKLLKIDYQTYDSSNIITIYYDNTFIKYILNSDLAYVNGKSYKLDTPIMNISGEIYIPLVFNSNALDYECDIDRDNGKVLLSKRNNKLYSTYKDIFFESRQMDNINLKLSIPSDWNQFESNQFGVWDEYSKYKITIIRQNISDGESINTFANNYKNKLMQKADVKMVFSDVKKIQIGQNLFEYFSYTDTAVYNNSNIDHDFTSGSSTDNTNQTEAEDKIPQFVNDHYILKSNNDIYIFNIVYSTKSNQDYLRNMFHGVLASAYNFKHDTSADLEHYVETPNYINSSFNLDSQIISNIEAFGKIIFSGYFKNTNNYDYLFATVQKGTQKLEFEIPLEKKNDGIKAMDCFDIQIYTPFGLGLHNITVSGLNQTKGISDTLLKFSAINLSTKSNQYLIPTKYVQSTSMEIDSITKIITMKSTNNFEKAREIFNFVTTNFKIDTSADQTKTQKTSIDVIKENSGSELEINCAIVAMYRNMNIPARIYSAHVNNEIMYFSEIELNGKWVIVDPCAQIIKNGQNSARRSSVIINSYNSFFAIKSEQYWKLLDNFAQLLY